jgi:hypothetical protein
MLLLPSVANSSALSSFREISCSSVANASAASAASVFHGQSSALPMLAMRLYEIFTKINNSIHFVNIFDLYAKNSMFFDTNIKGTLR